jgi:hypothetical protein
LSVKYDHELPSIEVEVSSWPGEKEAEVLKAVADADIDEFAYFFRVMLVLSQLERKVSNWQSNALFR